MTARALSIAHLTLLDQKLPDLITHAAAAGFTHASPRIHAPLPTDPFDPVIGDEPLLREAERRLRDTGLQILDVEAVWLRADTDPAALHPVLETGARLGARYVLTVGHDPDPARLSDHFAAFCGMARPYGMTVMLEFITYCAVANLPDALTLLRDTGAPNAGVLVDALHLARAGHAPADLRAVPPDLLPYAQFCDAPLASPPMTERRAEAIGGRLLPGDGELPLAELVAALPPGIPLTVEAPVRTMAALPPADRAKRAMASMQTLLRTGGAAP
ncbi:sugar phosphate isomerase/epimerase family protein [Muricoccus radiodurans]|uniref:sugar phosphate isomerase/epimerase family protein n=1 Tax=Muricoccus radiodurans TaxID=2231721 RepID=UPI003CEBB9C6